LPGWLVVGGLVAVLTVPLLVALGVLHSPQWYPMADLAFTELRVRDVLQMEHPPLMGLPGRITGYGEAGSHPGPLSFYALAPTYWLLGSTAWSLKVGVVVLDVVALGLTLVMVHRRGGPTATLSLAAGLAVLLRAYGAHQLTEPWNPFLPALWWVVFLVAVWCVLCDRLRWLPVVVFAGSYCAQTHLSYVPLVAVLWALTAGWVLVGGHRRRNDEPGLRRRTLLWGGASLLLAGLLWMPPLVEQFTNDPGNFTVITENFRHPSQDPISLARARNVWLARLDPVGMVTGEAREESWIACLSGLGLLLAWLATAVLAHRRTDLPGRRELLRLHLVLAVAVTVGFVAVARIVGPPWFYLHLWGVGTTLLLVVAMLWTVAAAAGRPLLIPPTGEAAEPAVPTGPTGPTEPTGSEPGEAAEPATTSPATTGPSRWSERQRRGAVIGSTAVLLAVTGVFTVDAAHTDIPSARLTRTLRNVAPDTIAALTAPNAPGGGKDGRYLVRWADPLGIGEHGWGLLDEMERAGLHVYVDTRDAVPARFHRLLEGKEPTAIVTIVGGAARIDDFREATYRQELAYFEPRTPAEQDRFDELRSDVEDDLERAGLSDRVNLDNSLFTAGLVKGVPSATRRELGEMIDLGVPVAVFVEPPPSAR
jgi:hypothetical protein